MKLNIIRSQRREKTIAAKIIKDELYIYLPAKLSSKEEKKWVDKIVQQMEMRKRKQDLNKDKFLLEHAHRLNLRYFNGSVKITSIEYVTNQNSLFGSCSIRSGAIRISHRLAKMPTWVRDYVIIHELAHLVQPNHSKSFWKLVNQYKYAERARGYLMAKGMEEDEMNGA